MHAISLTRSPPSANNNNPHCSPCNTSSARDLSPIFSSTTAPTPPPLQPSGSSSCLDQLCWMTILNQHVYIAISIGTLLFVVILSSRPIKLSKNHSRPNQPPTLTIPSLPRSPQRLSGTPFPKDFYWQDEGIKKVPSISREVIPPQPGPRDPSIQALFEDRYKQFARTAGHLAVSFNYSFSDLTQAKRIAIISAMLPHLAAFFERIEIPYWLDWGTLLGAYRSKAVIPWDDDGDFAIPAGKAALMVASQVRTYRFQCDCVFIVRYEFSRDDIPFLFVDRKTGIYIDIFQYAVMKRAGVVTNRMFPTYSPNTQDLTTVFPLGQCQLGSRWFSCPQNTKEYLIQLYGDLSVPYQYRADRLHDLEDADGEDEGLWDGDPDRDFGSKNSLVGLRRKPVSSSFRKFGTGGHRLRTDRTGDNNDEDQGSWGEPVAGVRRG